MNIVIIGYGKVGSELSSALTREGHDVIVIDNDPSSLKFSRNMHDIMFVEGNGATYSIQKEAGVENADILMACTSSDEVNMLCCLLAKKLGAKKAIARVRNPEYYDYLGHIKSDLGLSMAINPELYAAEEISRVIISPAAAKVELFCRGRVELVEYIIDDDSPLDEMSLIDINRKMGAKVLICAVQRGDEIFIPSGNFVLKKKDKIHISASHKEIKKFFKIVEPATEKIKNVLIIGGGRIGYYLAKQLIGLGMSVKIIESREEQCDLLCDLLPKATIIHGDASDHTLLKEEGIDSFDAFVALTGSDEENMILSLYAKHIEKMKVITKINSASYTGIAGGLDIDTVISPKAVTLNHVLGYVRAIENSRGSNVETVYRLVNGHVEILEFTVKENGAYVGVPLKDLKLKENLLIACIVRGNKIIIPDGSEQIMLDDTVIIATSNRFFGDLGEILE